MGVSERGREDVHCALHAADRQGHVPPRGGDVGLGPALPAHDLPHPVRPAAQQTARREGARPGAHEGPRGGEQPVRHTGLMVLTECS